MESSRAIIETPYSDLSKDSPKISHDVTNIGIQFDTSHVKSCETPFNLPPIVIMIGYCIVAILTGGMIYGWPFLSKIYQEAGLYHWLCLNDETDPLSITDSEGLCPYQRAAIEFLYTIGVSTGFFASILFGIMFAHLGPKVTASTSGILCIVSCIAIAASNKHFQLYIPAMMMMGVIIEVESMCLVTIRPLFPNNEGLIIGIIMSCLDLSWSIPGIMYYVSDRYDSITLSQLFYFLAGAIAFPCTLILIFTVPFKLYDKPKIENTHKSNYSNKSDSLFLATPSLSPLCSPTMNDSLSSHAANLETSNFPIPPSPLTLPKIGKGELIVYGKQHSGTSTNNSTPNSFSYHEEMSPFLNTSPQKSIFRQVYNLGLRQLNRVFDDETRSHIKDFNFLLFCVYFGWTNLRNVFFMNATEELLGIHLKEVLGIAVPFSFIPSLLSGVVLDRFGMGFSKFLNNAMGSLLYIFSFLSFITNNEIFGYFAVFFYVAQNWNFTLLYGYLAEKYGNIKDYGILIGLACLCSGTVTIFSQRLYKLVLVGDHLFNIMVAFMVVNLMFGILFSPLFPYLYEPRSKNKIH